MSMGLLNLFKSFFRSNCEADNVESSTDTCGQVITIEESFGATMYYYIPFSCKDGVSGDCFDEIMWMK